MLAEVLLIALVYGVGVLIVWRHYMVLGTTTWYATPSSDGSTLSLAGMWYGYVSLPIFQFLLCRWYFRLFIWTRFLWRVSRIELSLIPTHPDRVGGLGFLSNTAYAFGLLVLAHGALLAGQLANRIFYLGAALPDFKGEIALMVVFVLALVLGPLLVCASVGRGKRTGLRGARWPSVTCASSSQVAARRCAADEVFVGSGDIRRLPIWATAWRSCGPCASCRLPGT